MHVYQENMGSELAAVAERLAVEDRKHIGLPSSTLLHLELETAVASGK